MRKNLRELSIGRPRPPRPPLATPLTGGEFGITSGSPGDDGSQKSEALDSVVTLRSGTGGTIPISHIPGVGRRWSPNAGGIS